MRPDFLLDLTGEVFRPAAVSEEPVMCAILEDLDPGQPGSRHIEWDIHDCHAFPGTGQDIPEGRAKTQLCGVQAVLFVGARARLVDPVHAVAPRRTARGERGPGRAVIEPLNAASGPGHALPQQAADVRQGSVKAPPTKQHRTRRIECENQQSYVGHQTSECDRYKL
jgi:hypothetical protein